MGPRFSPGRFDALLSPDAVGQKLLWRRSSLCPCRSADSQQADVECPHCLGRGIFWAAGRAAHAGVLGQKAVRAWLDVAQIELGDQVLSVPGASPLHAAGEYDLMLMVDSSEPYAVVLERDGTEKADPAAYALDRCFWRRKSDKAIVDGSVPKVDGFTGALTWTDPGSAPPPGYQFSLRGRRRPTYFVFKDLPQDRAHGGGAALPRKIIARKFDLLGR